MTKVENKTRAPKGGREIVCPECDRTAIVYHFSWLALKCTWCKAEINKNDWKTATIQRLIEKQQLMVEMPRKENALDIPAWLRRYQIDGKTLLGLISSLELVSSHLKGYGPECLNQSDIQTLDDLREQLVQRKKGWPAREPVDTHPEPLPNVAEPIDPSTISLKATLKERVGLQIVVAIEGGCNTFARIRKAIPTLRVEGQDIEMPDRVLKSALRYMVGGRRDDVRIVKVSKKVYAIERGVIR